MNDTFQPKPVLFFFKRLANLPTAFIYASRASKDYYNSIEEKLRTKPYKVIQAPVKREHTSGARKIKELKRPLRLVLVGYINHHKGIDILLRALSGFSKEEVVCDIIGPVLGTRAKYKKGLDALSNETAVELNYLGFKKIDNDLLDQYDFYICSSRREASPMSVWEAMSMGLPIIIVTIKKNSRDNYT